jgi:hypothetical protein
MWDEVGGEEMKGGANKKWQVTTNPFHLQINFRLYL